MSLLVVFYSAKTVTNTKDKVNGKDRTKTKDERQDKSFLSDELSLLMVYYILFYS